MPDRPSKIYSATYSNVPVYEYAVEGNHIMRRRSDDWINATHILKVAAHDKPARTRILEREVQKGVHEKIQGGYGKYQGTWIPLPEGRLLAEKNGVLEKLLPIFDYVPGDRSPPPAPKHATAVASKPRAPRQSNGSRRPAAPSFQQQQQQKQKQKQKQQPPQPRQQPSQLSEVSYDAYSVQETPERASAASESDVEMMSSQYSNYQSGRNRKRKRQFPDEPEAMSHEEQHHLLWTDELLDYFMLQNSNDPLPAPPEPPQPIDLNRAVDEKGHTPMHWAAAMGDLNVVRDLVRRGAHIDSVAFNGETPLMRSVLFTNNFDKKTMDHLIRILDSTVHQKDYCHSTVFHHIAATTCSKSKYQCAKYYLDSILDHVSVGYSPQQLAGLLDQRDQNGDTAILIAARFGARKCVRTLLAHRASVTIPNNKGHKAEELIEQLNARRRERYGVQSLGINSSSPVHNGLANASTSHTRMQPVPSSSNPLGNPNSVNNTNNPLPSSVTGTPHSFKTNGAKRQKTMSYQSEAAQLLTSQLPVLISSRTEALASALETELVDREHEVTEGERVLEARRRDLSELKARYEVLLKEYADSVEDQAAEEAEAMELQSLEDEARTLLEDEQDREIGKLVQNKNHQDAFMSADDSGIAMLTNGVSQNGSPTGKDDTESESRQKLHLAQELAAKQAQQMQLLEALIKAHASTSSGDSSSQEAGAPSSSSQSIQSPVASQGMEKAADKNRKELYKRLITMAVDVPPEDVEAALPEILSELEDAKREREQGVSFGPSADDGEELLVNASATVQNRDVDGLRGMVGVAG